MNKILLLISVVCIASVPLFMSTQNDLLSELKQLSDTYVVEQYSCTFTRQEVLDGKQRPVEVAEVIFRENPFSIYMVFTKHSKIKRLLYVEGEFINWKGQECIVVEPTGLSRILTKSFWLPVDYPVQNKESRMPITSFGFKNILDRFIKSVDSNGNIFTNGTGNIGNRPTYAFVHGNPPYEVVIHIDEEWKIPVASFIVYEGRLVGRYLLENINLDIDLSDFTFDDKALGF